VHAPAHESVLDTTLAVLHYTDTVKLISSYTSVVSVLADDGQRQQMQSALTLGMQSKNPTPPRYYTSIISFSGVGGDHQRQRMQVALRARTIV
jgi:hypothetical protein